MSLDLSHHVLDRRMAAAAQTRARADQAILLYDGECAFCQRSVELLHRLDWFHVVHCQNARDIDQLPSTPPLTPERLLEEMHLVTSDRKTVYHGFGAFRWLAWRLPLLCAFAPLLYLPGVPKWGQRLYLWVARHRFQLMPCRHGSCAVPSVKVT